MGAGLAVIGGAVGGAANEITLGGSEVGAGKTGLDTSCGNGVDSVSFVSGLDTAAGGDGLDTGGGNGDVGSTVVSVSFVSGLDTGGGDGVGSVLLSGLDTGGGDGVGSVLFFASVF